MGRKKLVGAYLQDDMFQLVQKKAAYLDISVSDVVRIALREYCKE